MNSESLVGLTFYKSSIETVLKNIFGLSEGDISTRKKWSLDELAIFVNREISKHLIKVHPIYEIAKKYLDDVVIHTNAIERLKGSPAIMLHSRHIEEIATAFKFILSEPEKYNMFEWKWRNYQMVHAIRNRLVNLNAPLDLELQNWIESNIVQLQQWVDKKFTVDSAESFNIWRKYNNWLFPATIKATFESTESVGSYEAQEYSWNSHAVHFSPLSNHLFELCIPEHTYEQIS